MRLRHYLLLSCLPVLGACQSLSAPSEAGELTRLQGELFSSAGQLVLQPCDSAQQVILREGNSNLFYEVAQLGEKGTRLFIDLDGQLDNQNPATLNAAQIYRLEREGHGCAGARERRLILQAQGHEPNWMIQVQNQGLVLIQMGQEPLALPYMEEQLGAGRSYFSSQANDQQLELWIAPQRCIDSMSGTLYHLSAELRLNGQIQRGCASYGGGRNRDY